MQLFRIDFPFTLNDEGQTSSHHPTLNKAREQAQQTARAFVRRATEPELDGCTDDDGFVTVKIVQVETGELYKSRVCEILDGTRAYEDKPRIVEKLNFPLEALQRDEDEDIGPIDPISTEQPPQPANVA